MPGARVDHLVVACADLAQGARWARETLGADPQPGGRHAAMGTHNAVLRLGARTYLELLAIDPDAPAPPHPRWFGLDGADTRRPFLASWVIAPADLGAALSARSGGGPPQPFSRGTLSWRMALSADPLLPALIAWDGGQHPVDRLPESGCALESVEVALPDPEPLRRLLSAAGVTGVVIRTGPRELRAHLRTPHGTVVL